jgi:hypothetical protein
MDPVYQIVLLRQIVPMEPFDRIQSSTGKLEEPGLAFAPWHDQIEWLHVVAAAIWSFSTAVAYTWYPKPVLRRAAQRPDDAELRATT